tara:strand:- start:319 stop:2445 length:2127 start_codon:yes stop_codon:yes gene_type:complete
MPSSEKVISPGVFTNEIDQSFLPAALSDIGAAIVGPTVKGPAGIPTVVNSYSEFQAKFGDTFLSGSDYYTYLTSLTAKNYLKHGSSLLVTRILPTGFSSAHSIVSASTTTGDAIANGTFDFTGTFGTVAEDEVQITVGATEYRFITADPAGGIPADSSPVFYFNTGSNTGNFATQLSTKVDAASIGVLTTAVSASKKFEVTASTAGASGNAISVDTGSGTNMKDSLTLTGGTNSTTSTVSFKLHTLSDGTSQNSVSNDAVNNILPSGSKNNVRWEISNKNDKKGTFTLLIRRGDDTSKRKQTMETWNNLSLDPNQNNYIGKVVGDSVWTVKDAGTADPFLQMSGSFPNKSKYVRVEVVGSTVDYLDENGNIRLNELSASLPTLASGSFSGGSDGGTNFTHPQSFYDKISNTNTQGLNLGTAAKGKTAYEDALNLLSNSDEYDYNLLLLPGIVDNFANHSSVVTKAVDVCEDRGDCFVVTDPVEYAGALTTATSVAENRDSNFAAMYWPWVQIQDDERGKPVWVPPSVTIGGIYAFNDKVAQPWFAPAGLNRGGIDVAIQAERKLTQNNRDTLYESNVNPIATFPNQGVCVWGQKTLQKKSSALDRVNVRRLLIKVKKFIAASSRFLVFEQNNAATRRRFLNIVNPFLEQIQSNSGLSAFRVVMDESNNTPDTIDRNILYGQLFLQPTRTAEFVVLDFTVQPTGATFPE